MIANPFSWSLRLLCVVLPLILAACSSVPATKKSADLKLANHGTTLPLLPAAGSGRGGYYLDDGPGDQPPENLYALPNATPKVEPYLKTATNRPYVVFGKTYTPIIDDRPFKQRGIGSWYGKRYHGRKTSSGEPYDMYQMTAAHPSLPIPSYVRVTNLSNGTQIIVRINDRGPFHSGRIIDLSYAAALKLGYLSSGSSQLEVERILPDEIIHMASHPAQDSVTTTALVDSPAAVTLQPLAPLANAAPLTTTPNTNMQSGSVQHDGALLNGYYLQFGAYTEQTYAEAAHDKLVQSLQGVVSKLATVFVNGLYRLYAGPYASRPDAQNIMQMAWQRSGAASFIVER